MNITTNKSIKIGVISVVVAGGGIGAFYIWRKRKNRHNNAPVQLSLFDDAIEELSTEAPLIDIDSVEKERIQKILDEPITIKQIEDDMPIVPINIFKNPYQNAWDQEAEMASRTSTAPYILHYEEFIEDQMGYHQQTVTYYLGDDIMADEDDTPIYNYSGIMGELKFGHGSNDPNVVYIRNEQMHQEWEVLKHPGSFAYEVLGHQMEDAAENELHHSVYKFKRE